MAQIVWTVLPNGFDGPQRLRLSIFVSLRLDAGTLGSTFNWPTKVLNLSDPKMLFDNGGATEERAFTIERSLITPTLWNGVFPSSATVNARVHKDYLPRARVSFPTKEIRTRIEQVYKDTAENFGLKPLRFGEYEDNEGLLFDFLSEVGELLTGFEKEPDGGPVVSLQEAPQSHPPLSTLDSQHPFYRAHRFYRRNLDNANTVPPDGPQRPVVPSLDVHQAMAMLGDHPQLLRRLGLIIDGTVQRGSLPTTGDTRVRFSTSEPGSITPPTRYTLDGNLFVATPNAAKDTDLDRGMVRIGDTARFELQQMDTDGGALKLVDYAVNLSRVADAKDAHSGEAPTLRTAGFVVARQNRASRIGKVFERSNEINAASGNVDLFADDLTRGFRLDVMRESEAVWRSLNLRQGAFLIGAQKVRVPQQGDIHDEGYVKASGATSVVDGPDDKPLYTHEVLFGWDGWSQVIRPPGRTTVFNHDNVGQDPPVPLEEVEQVENTPATDFPVEPQFKVEPGTLPKLRFGEKYSLRARAVDLAGNSLPLATTTGAGTLRTEFQTFQRYEPVPQPVLVLRRPIVEGESVEHIVIRTKSGDFNGPQVFFSSNDRHVAPPTTTLDMVLMHGKLDSVFNDPTRSFNIALKSEGTFLDQEIWDSRGRRVRVNGIQVVNSLGVAPGTPADFPINRGDGLKPGQYVIHTNNKLALPYLPDPLAIGVALADDRAEEHQSSAVGLKMASFVGTWPDLEPFKIRVESTNGAEPSVVVQNSGFVVRLPPGTIQPLRMSSLISDAALTMQMAIFALMSTTSQASLKPEILKGQHWMFTPRRQIVAVHAVERPLRAAKFTALDVEPDRLVGNTFVYLQATVDNHSHSTGQIDIEANWVDPVDLLTEPGPTEEVHEGRVVSYRPEYEESSAQIPFLGLALDEEERPKHDFGDTKHRIVKYRPDTTTRYREYFPPSVTSDRQNILMPGEPKELNILSSARPRAPEVLYVVPTFRWESEGQGGPGQGQQPSSMTSRRIGRGFRVYLSRPWFSSGVGELLGVVIPEDQNPPSEARRYISEWGSDPIWRTEGPTTQIAATDFLNAATSSSTSLSVGEEAGVTVKAVGFNVAYNAERQVWFADIEMGAVASYFPFVRLALARYQPDSVDNAHLSPIVRAEFAQLVNDRVATLQFQPDTIRVSVSGVAARSKLGDEIAGLPDPPGPPPAAPPGFKLDRQAGAGRIVSVRIERKGPGNSSLEWEPVGERTILPSFTLLSPATSTEVLWTGDVPRPPRTPASFDHRMLIEEVELYQTDAETVESVPVALPQDAKVRGRVVYLDILTF